VISPTADNMCDLFNSFIEADLDIWINNTVTLGAFDHYQTESSGTITARNADI
jgi:hypothetical protein